MRRRQRCSGATVNFNVPAPPLPTEQRLRSCLLARLQPRSSARQRGCRKMRLEEATMVKVTGMVIDRPGLVNWVMMISPV